MWTYLHQIFLILQELIWQEYYFAYEFPVFFREKAICYRWGMENVF